MEIKDYNEESAKMLIWFIAFFFTVDDIKDTMPMVVNKDDEMKIISISLEREQGKLKGLKTGRLPASWDRGSNW